MSDPVSESLLLGRMVMGHLDQVMWLALRIGSALLAAPMFGTRAIPVRVRLLLALTLSLVLSPLVPKVAGFSGVNASFVLSVAHELVVGIAIGLLLRLAFEAGSLAGELVAQGMGLSFAQMADPLQGINSGVVGQWFYAAFALLFLALDGHLRLIELLFHSYASVPIGHAGTLDPLLGVVTFLADVLVSAVRIALPVMIAMLTTNLAFGVLARTAPALNPIAVGLPAAQALGLMLLMVLTGRLLDPVAGLLDSAFVRATELLR